MNEAEQLHHDSLVVDAHSDLLMLVSLRPGIQQSRYFREHWIPQLRAGGIDVQCLSVFVGEDVAPESMLRRTVRMIECAHRIAEQNADQVTLCLTGADVDSAVAAGRIALVLALEGCDAIGVDVDLLQTLFRLGVRIASLTHFGRNPLADGSAEEDTHSRLTRAGLEAVTVMERIGMLVDVSHLAGSGVDHLVRHTRRPVVATHSSAWVQRPHHRNLTDERLRVLAQSGGVVGVAFVAGLIDPDRPTLSRIVDHIAHVVSVAGIEHVGLGPDFVKEVHEETLRSYGASDDVGFDRRRFVPGLGGPEGLPKVTEALLSHGFSADQVRLILGENWVRLFRAQLGIPGDGQQERSNMPADAC
ncbi:dipeptidase [Kribbella sancticallisti]|uniref:Dipeptidase n=1 Tax=Kribbella sancticallisti TaxID=460087 RepID=A0ABN2CQM6_9ACTN